MNKLSKHIIILGVLITSLIFISSCKKDEAMELTIIVKMMSDTTILVPNAQVKLMLDPIRELGNTDSNGEIKVSFDLPTQFRIEANLDTLFGSGQIYLNEEGQHYSKSIFLY